MDNAGNLADVWIKRREALTEELAEERKRADALIKRLCDGLLGNISAVDLEGLNNAEKTVMKFPVCLTDTDLDGIRIFVARAAARDYIEKSNNEMLDIIFRFAPGDDWNEFLLLITKKGAVEGDK